MHLKVVVGSNSLSTGGATYDVEKTISHEFYLPWLPVLFKNDIGLIKVKTNIYLDGTSVKTIAICDKQPPTNSLVTVSGWGLTANGNTKPPDRLQYLQYKTISWLSCLFNLLPNIVWNNFICAQATTTYGFCSGDSGGPLVYNNQQIGIVSWGILCARGKPDVYVNACKYKGWVNNKIAKN